MKVESANFGKFTAVETLFNQLFGQLKSMRTILAIIFMTFGTYASAADFAFGTRTYSKSWTGLARDITVAYLELTGPIQKGDYKEYLDTYEWITKKYDLVASITLNSNGGLVEEAMLIGKHVRRNRLITWVDYKKRCYSSCALIFLSGLNRYSIGAKVGVHRSYFKKGTNLSFDELEESLGDSH